MALIPQRNLVLIICQCQNWVWTFINISWTCFPRCWKVSFVVPDFKKVGKRSWAKNYCLVSLSLSVVSKIFKKLVNNRFVDHLEKYGLFSDFQYCFMSSRSIVNLLLVASDRIAGAFDRSGATRTLSLDISKLFDLNWHADLLHKLKFYGASVWVFRITSSFLSNRLQGVVSVRMSQE